MHTPGPWKVIKPGHGQKTKLRCVQIGSDDRYATSEMELADARLIAMSPELLEACRQLVGAMNNLDKGHHREVSFAESIIAKATGAKL